MSTKEEINALLAKHELTVKSVFVPWSQSRNAGEKSPSLNWKVTLVYKGKNILTTDYTAGCGHCPSYQQRETVDSHRLVLYECERGKRAGYFEGALNSVMPPVDPKKRGDILPDPADVIYSLLMDAGVLDYGSFAEWAKEFGYNSDSISDKKIYDACLEIAIRFNKLGAIIPELREAFQDY